jgi:serine/threonine-protein kinase
LAAPPRKRNNYRVPASEPVRQVGRYTLYGEIASGGMATVHLGALTGPGGFRRTVAIKRLHPQLARDPEFATMLLDEARLAAHIVHPNVIPTLDVVESEGELFLVMEYTRGLSLSRLLRTIVPARIPTPIAMSIVAGMLRGLHAAHEATDENDKPLDIVHRDVSPQNLLVGADGVARVLDFGIAKAVGRLQDTHDGRIKGKLAYMAPEQLSGAKVTRRADVFAASVVMWELVAGRRLFRGETDAAVLSEVLNADIEPPSDGALPDVDAIAMRGLERDPCERYPDAREMADAIETRVGVASAKEVAAWLEDAGKAPLQERDERVTKVERAVQRAEKRRSKRRVAIGAAAIAGLAAIAGTAFVVSPGPGPASTEPAAPPASIEGTPPQALEVSPTAPAPEATPPRRPPVRTAAPRAAKHACSPYVIDQQGHKVFDPACM